jgi:ABC-type uncharacterized transport system substrate-binding protein
MKGGAAEFVNTILRGAKPGDLPIEQPAKFKPIVNRKTATTIEAQPLNRQ